MSNRIEFRITYRQHCALSYGRDIMCSDKNLIELGYENAQAVRDAYLKYRVGDGSQPRVALSQKEAEVIRSSADLIANAMEDASKTLDAVITTARIAFNRIDKFA